MANYDLETEKTIYPYSFNGGVFETEHNNTKYLMRVSYYMLLIVMMNI